MDFFSLLKRRLNSDQRIFQVLEGELQSGADKEEFWASHEEEVFH